MKRISFIISVLELLCVVFLVGCGHSKIDKESAIFPEVIDSTIQLTTESKTQVQMQEIVQETTQQVRTQEIVQETTQQVQTQEIVQETTQQVQTQEIVQETTQQVQTQEIVQETTQQVQEEKREMKLYINNTEIPVLWENNKTVNELKEVVKNGDIVVSMSMYSDNEQVGSLGKVYSSNDFQTTTHSRDIVLYNSSNIVVFYGSNTWEYTRLGQMQISENEATRLLSNGNVTLRITMMS